MLHIPELFDFVLVDLIQFQNGLIHGLDLFLDLQLPLVQRHLTHLLPLVSVSVSGALDLLLGRDGGYALEGVNLGDGHLAMCRRTFEGDLLGLLCPWTFGQGGGGPFAYFEAEEVAGGVTHGLPEQ